MKQKQLLKNSIETLKLLQVEMHDSLDSSKQAKLSKIIQDLEQCHEISKLELRQVLGEILLWLPAIKNLIAMWFSE